MNEVLLAKAIKLDKERKRRQWWKKVVQTMVAVVVFCTTYALILPAITMEQKPVCGMEAHEHTDACYTTQHDYGLNCTFTSEDGVKVLHAHSDLCRGPDGTLLCSLAENPGHVHGDECYGEQVLICSEETAEIQDFEDDHITERVLICDLEEQDGHTHNEMCTGTEQVLICDLEEQDGHIHDEKCTGTEQVLICELEEQEGHIHTDTCKKERSKLVCEAEETEQHDHSEDCFEVEFEIGCGLEEKSGHAHHEECFEIKQTSCNLVEAEGHTHGEECFETKQISCDLEETEAHTHGEDCYELNNTYQGQETHVHQDACYAEAALICGMEELRLHQHAQACFDEEGTLICGLPEVLEHNHTTECLENMDTEIRVLVCTLEEHIHEDICYADESSRGTPDFVCGYGEHSHVESCQDENGQIICSIPEHTHSAICVVPDLDLTADVETEEIWEQMLADVELTGNWPEDLLAVANTQKDYRASKKNAVFLENQLMGYTRYGEKYQDPYGPWSGMFVRFCMDYAEISYYPQEYEPAAWAELLEKEKYFREPEGHIPKAGDLIFFRSDEGEGAGTMGIVKEVIPETQDQPARIRVIQGDYEDRVAVMTYKLSDSSIFGYGEMLPGYAVEKNFQGEDYAITASFTREAKIPQHADMSVREILPDTEEYESYYRQSVESLMEEGGMTDEADLNLSFARFFDITFSINGEKIEPAAPVAVQVQYVEPIILEPELVGKAVHFAEEGVELLDVTLSGTAPLVEEEETELPQQVDTFSFTQESFSVVATVLANTRAANVTVWLDGTCGGLMAYYYENPPTSYVTLQNGILPTEWPSPSRYAYKLKGWYDVTHSKYYEPGATVQDDVTANTVFYADWIAESYNIGQNVNTVESQDTNSFVTTYVFDYNTLFNIYSANVTSSTANRNGHSETWTLLDSGKVKYQNGDTLNFIFRDHDRLDNGLGKITYPVMPAAGSNANAPDPYDVIQPGLYTEKLADILFDPSIEVVGKHYVGTGNYLYQYMESGELEGYFYYDSAVNAAAYNQQDERFYIYNYKEYSYDTIRNEDDDKHADFLPLNYPSSNSYYDGKVTYRSQNESDEPYARANFMYGIRSDIQFYLPDDAGSKDANGNYLNKSATGDVMVFEFYGDDDVWVLVDGMLLLDVGGMHTVRGGKIDFSEGRVYTSRGNTDQFDSKSFDEILGANNKIKEGPHVLTILYLERGSSMSNCKLLFNLAPRYGLDLTKKDYVTGETLAGVEFSVYKDEACTQPAKLWHTKADASKENADQLSTNTFTTGADGTLHSWGWVSSKTYYIKETKVPDGYVASNDVIRVTLNNHGADVSEVTVIRRGENSAGYEVTHHQMDKDDQRISLIVTNKKVEDQLTAIRVEKKWADGTVSQVPVEFNLLADGTVKDTVTLSVDNSWGHTWENLSVTDRKGKPITYSIEEMNLSGYRLDDMTSTTLESEIVNWVKVGALEDSATFMLALDANAMLSASNSQFSTVTQENVKNNALWIAKAYRDGFQLHNGQYYLAFNNSSKAFYLTATAGEGNQTFYYDGVNLFVMSNNIHYYVGSVSRNNLSADQTANSTALYKRVVTREGTVVYQFTNSQILPENMKSLRVKKLWAGDYDKIPDSVQIRIKLEGQTVTTLELTKANNWTAEYSGLDEEYLQQGKYFLEEITPFGFKPEYGEIQQVGTDQWKRTSRTNGLETGKVYAFVANNRALADDNGTVKATTFSNNTPALNQQWQVVECTTKDGTIQVLRNKATNRYMREYDQKLYLVDNADANCSIRLYNSKLQYVFSSATSANGWTMSVSNTGNVTINTWGANSNGTTAFTVHELEQNAYYEITVTNTYAVYSLPETGGPGTIPTYALGGLLILTTAVTYLHQAVRRRRKGGR